MLTRLRNSIMRPVDAWCMKRCTRSLSATHGDFIYSPVLPPVIQFASDDFNAAWEQALSNVSYPSPEGEGLSAALSRSVPKSEICPSLQASLHAPTNRRGPRLAGTLASDLPETASNRISAVPFRARVWQSRTGSASNGLPRGCLRCPSTIQEMDLI